MAVNTKVPNNRWVALSSLLSSKLFALLNGTSMEWNELGLSFISRSFRMEILLEISILPLGSPCFPVFLHPGVRVPCSSHSRLLKWSSATRFAPLLCVRARRAVCSSFEPRDIDKFLLLLCPTWIRTGNGGWAGGRGRRLDRKRWRRVISSFSSSRTHSCSKSNHSSLLPQPLEMPITKHKSSLQHSMSSFPMFLRRACDLKT